MPVFDFPEIPAYPVHSIKIVASGEPVGKGRPRIGMNQHTRRPVAYTPSHTRKYEGYIKLCANQVMAGRGLVQGALELHVAAYIPIPKSWSQKKQQHALNGEILPTAKPDADNFLKLAADACNGIVYRDDSAIVYMCVKKRYSDKPRLEIEIFPA